jgi:hypothetical protein
LNLLSEGFGVVRDHRLIFGKLLHALKGPQNNQELSSDLLNRPNLSRILEQMRRSEQHPLCVLEILEAFRSVRCLDQMLLDKMLGYYEQCSDKWIFHFDLYIAMPQAINDRLRLKQSKDNTVPLCEVPDMLDVDLFLEGIFLLLYDRPDVFGNENLVKQILNKQVELAEAQANPEDTDQAQLLGRVGTVYRASIAAGSATEAIIQAIDEAVRQFTVTDLETDEETEMAQTGARSLPHRLLLFGGRGEDSGSETEDAQRFVPRP